RRLKTPAVREMAWRCLVAIGAGAIVGLVIGGVGGRLVMLVLRLTSDSSVQGVLTDDGFRIGQFTTATIFLLTVTAGLGGATSALYLFVRGALPRPGRAIVWGLFMGLYGGADI